MAARWIGLARRKRARISRRRRGRFLRELRDAIGAAGALFIAAAMNFALYPDALAAVVSGELQIVGFVPEEPAFNEAPAPTAAAVLDEAEVHLLAATAWAEARSEGEEGMRAVAHVILNRVGDRFGDDLETVILAPKQFSAWNLGDPNRPLAQNPERYATEGINLTSWETAQQVAREVLSGQSVDPTEGALFYHTRAIRPWWSRYGQGRREIGAHVFYRDVPDRTGRRGRVTEVADRTPRVIDGSPTGRISGVIAPTALTRSENDAATPTIDGVPITSLRAAPLPDAYSGSSGFSPS